MKLLQLQWDSTAESSRYNLPRAVEFSRVAAYLIVVVIANNAGGKILKLVRRISSCNQVQWMKLSSCIIRSYHSSISRENINWTSGRFDETFLLSKAIYCTVKIYVPALSYFLYKLFLFHQKRWWENFIDGLFKRRCLRITHQVKEQSGSVPKTASHQTRTGDGDWEQGGRFRAVRALGQQTKPWRSRVDLGGLLARPWSSEKRAWRQRCWHMYARTKRKFFATNLQLIE